jgi:hypothetical protein
LVNYNLDAYPRQIITLAATTGQIILGGLDTAPPGDSTHPNLVTSTFALILSIDAGKPVNYTGEPVSNVCVPVLDSFDDDRKTAAIILALIRWGTYFEGILTGSTQPVHVVLSNTCQGAFTYEIRGDSAIFMGQGNLASSKYEDMVMSVDLDPSKFIIEPNTIALSLKEQDSCQYTIRIYPTKEGDDYYNDMFPLIITITVAAVFLMTAAVFYFYDLMVERRQKVVLTTAQRSTAIVSSIFPRQVRDQLLQAPVQGNATKLRSLANASRPDHEGTPGGHMNADIGLGASSGPIADLFPNCTGTCISDHRDATDCGVCIHLEAHQGLPHPVVTRSLISYYY